ncbi:M23 family metallopeptidase [Sphingomonas sabuli]|nr:M23 family metallopeptidase [Sphingomonas sabuli]
MRSRDARRRRDRGDRTITVIATAVVTFILTSAVWIFVFNIINAPKVETSGEVAEVKPSGEPAVAVAEGVVVGPAGLAIPVMGIQPTDLVDTYTQARAGGARSHDAIDIMAAEGTPIVAAAPGTVEKIYYSDGGGGKTVYVRSQDGRWNYYYAHLASYAPGLTEGQRISRGQLLGRVGHTGNASPDGPHLHFAINRMAAGQKWYDGDPVNPYPLLAGKRVSG